MFLERTVSSSRSVHFLFVYDTCSGRRSITLPLVHTSRRSSSCITYKGEIGSWSKTGSTKTSSCLAEKFCLLY